MNVWIENTTSKNDHGGLGWEFGKCIWSPAVDRRGAERQYSIMRSVKKGDRVINCYDAVIRGISIAECDCYTIHDRPPHPEPWGYANKFYRFNLSDFTELEDPVPLKQLVERYKDVIRDDIETNRPKYYLYSWWPKSEFYPDGRIVLSQGRFLARGTPALVKMMCELLHLDEQKLLRSVRP